MAKPIRSFEDLEFDDRNANLGTELGQQRLEDSLRYRGAGRGVLADKNGKLIAGNKTVEKAAELGLKIIVVPTRGDTLVVTQREDLDLDVDDDARMLAYEDNRIAQLDLQWDVDKLTEDATAGLELGHIFPPDYIDNLVAKHMAGELTPETTLSEEIQKQEAAQAKLVKCPCGCDHYFTPDRWYDADEVDE